MQQRNPERRADTHRHVIIEKQIRALRQQRDRLNTEVRNLVYLGLTPKPDPESGSVDIRDRPQGLTYAQRMKIAELKGQIREVTATLRRLGVSSE